VGEIEREKEKQSESESEREKALAQTLAQGHRHSQTFTDIVLLVGHGFNHMCAMTPSF